MNHEEFYARCARLLNSEHDYHEPGRSDRLRRDGTVSNTYKTRWNGREPGNGRFLGHGLIRHFGSVIHVNLRDPPLIGYFPDEDAVLMALVVATGRQETYSDQEIEKIRQHAAEANAAARAAVRAAGVIPNQIIIIGRYLKLPVSDRAHIAFSMGIPISAIVDTDFQRFLRVVQEIKKQDRLAELWAEVQIYEQAGLDDTILNQGLRDGIKELAAETPEECPGYAGDPPPYWPYP